MKCLERAGKETGLAFVVVGGVGLKVPVREVWLVWFEFSTVSKERSIQAFLLACPDTGQKEKRE